MTLESTNDTDQPQLKTTGAHRRRRKHPSALTRSIAIGGAAVCIGVANDLSTPVADAFSIVLPVGSTNGVGNSIQINIFEGNIFMPQLSLGTNASNNSTAGNIAIGNGNDIGVGGAVANGNVMQINLFSFNIFNPQFSLFGNFSNNTSINNVAMNNGNNSLSVGSAGSLFPFLGAPAGNGNIFQFSLFSGNIFNPQYSIGGNISHNTTVTNAAINNGNYSNVLTNLFGLVGAIAGNGNVFQLGFFVSNIFNPQYSFGGGNTSNNSATTNTASGNGNNSGSSGTGSGLSVGGTTGNGNTTQVAGGSGNISNDQTNVGINLFGSNGSASNNQQQTVGTTAVGSNNSNISGVSPVSLLSTKTTASVVQQQSVDTGAAGSNESKNTGTQPNTAGSNESTSTGSHPSTGSTVIPNTTTSGSTSLSFAPTTKVSDTSAPSGTSTTDKGSASPAGSDAGGGAGGSSGGAGGSSGGGT